MIIETCDWPVEVQTFPLDGRVPRADGEWSVLATVPPRQTRRFHVHDGIDLMVRELPIPAVHNGGPALEPGA